VVLHLKVVNPMLTPSAKTHESYFILTLSSVFETS